MSKKRIITAAIIVVLFLGGVAFFNRHGLQATFSSGKKTEAPAANNKISVKVVSPQEAAQSQGAFYKSTLEADREGIVSAKNSGRVVSILFEDGKQVAQGEALVILDDQDIKNQIKAAESQLEVLKASLQKAEAGLENTQRTYDRTKVLAEQGAVAQADLENAETSLKMIKADVASCQANIQAAQTTIDNLNTALAEMTIRSPISGVMDGKNVSLGQILAPGSVLGKVNDISLINAAIEVDQAKISKITAGQKATVKIDDNSQGTYEGVVKSISAAADPASRAFNVKVQLTNDKSALKPGVYAKVLLEDETKAKSFAIPVTLITGKEGNYYVFINDNGVAKKRAVTVGNLTSNQAEITSGLQGNESIIATNLNMIQEGDEITVASE